MSATLDPAPDAPADPTEHEIRELTDQFYVTLRASVSRLPPSNGDGRAAKVRTDIDALLNGSPRRTWSRAYQIEQLMVDILDERALDVDLQTRRLEAESTLRPALTAQYSKLAGSAKTADDRRALLARLVNDLQWRYTVNEVNRAYSKDITKVTAIIFISAIAAFAVLMLGMAVSGESLARGGDALRLLLAGLAGGWGAGFSMLSSLRTRLDRADLNDLKLMKSRWILWSRPLIGVGAACILYFFLTSGLLGGAAFPNLALDQSAGASVAADGPGSAVQVARRELALLIVWCFLAGFSERLVPALLAKAEDDRTKPAQVKTSERAAADNAASAGSNGAAT